MKLLGETRSICPKCFKEIQAKVVERNGKSVMIKTCEKHGTFEALHVWDDPVMYASMTKLFNGINTVPDELGFDLTSRCNMRCPFCFVYGGENNGKKFELKKKEILKSIKNLENRTIVFSGGEPTIRDDLFDLIKEVKKRKLRAAILTNGLNLDKKYVRKLKELGLDKIQIQFDALNDDIYQMLRGRKCLDSKLNAISNLENSGIYVNLFVMLAKNANDKEIKNIIDFCVDNSKTVRGVIFSSLCYEGRHNFELKKMRNSEIMKNIEEQAGIKKKDFLECTEFDVIFSQTVGKKIRTKSISPCDTVCYLYVNGNKVVPVNRLLNLSLATRLLRKNPSMKSFFFSILLPSNFRKFVKKREAIPLLAKMFFSTLRQLALSKTKMDYIVGVVVTDFHDRYNLDLNFLENCTIRSYDGKDFVPFCEKNIFWNKDITNHSSPKKV